VDFRPLTQGPRGGSEPQPTAPGACCSLRRFAGSPVRYWRLRACAVLMLGSLLLTGALPTRADGPSVVTLKAQKPLPDSETGAANPGPQRFVRVRVTILGIFSPRGVFNLVVRLYKLKGLARYKFDMPDALMTLDFKPGVAVEPSTIRNVMVRAGYQPGPFKIELLPISAASSNEPGWLTPPRVESKSALIRWFELNF